MMVSVFTGATPPFHCRDNSSSAAGNHTLVSGAFAFNSSLPDAPCFSSDGVQQDNRTERVPCGHGWVYSQEVFLSTTVTEVRGEPPRATGADLTQFVFGLVEIPARSMVLFLLPLSRRYSQCGFLAVGGLACLLMLAIPRGVFSERNNALPLRLVDYPNVLTGLAMAGKFGITASFASIYVYTAEIFPTVLRQTGIGVTSMFARMGGVLAPIINMLQNRSPTTPLVIFGTSPLLGALLALALPETAGRPLPDTVDDVENWDVRPLPAKENQEMCDDAVQSLSGADRHELQHLAVQN